MRTSETPVLVIHGVATRDRDAFAAEVERLAEAVGAENPFVPVFWGDLARPHESVETVLPYLDWMTPAGEDEEVIGTRRARVRRRALGAVYRTVRERYLVAAGQFAGDIILYQRRETEIHARVWETLIKHAPGWGVAERPVHVVTHSLGGSVLFDMAVSGQPRLHVDHLLTCACTAPYFHVIGCSPAPLDATPPGEHATLPTNVRSWTNYYIPLDPWGYLASPVFQLNDGSLPLDVELHTGEREDRLARHGASHYWRHPSVITGIRDALGTQSGIESDKPGVESDGEPGAASGAEPGDV